MLLSSKKSVELLSLVHICIFHFAASNIIYAMRSWDCSGVIFIHSNLLQYIRHYEQSTDNGTTMVDFHLWRTFKQLNYHADNYFNPGAGG